MIEKRTKSTKLNHKKEIALSALLTEPTIQSAAKVAGISEPTLWRWLKESEFSQEYRNLKRESVVLAVSRLQKISGEAVDVLRNIMLNEDTPPSTRVASAKSILEMAVKAIEIDDITKRLEVLEEIIVEEEKTSEY